MEWLIIALLIINLVVVGFLLWRKPKIADNSQSMLLLQQQMQELGRAMDTRLGEGTRTMNESVQTQFRESQRLISSIQEVMSRQLTEVAREQTKTNEATTRFMTIAEQLSNLEKVLTHQKQRGNWGEASLELVLSNFLPPNQFKMQYQFEDGETVDAAIFTKEGIIPVDAKFSLDNYNRLSNAIDEAQRTELERAFKNDLKLRIDETSKYVRPKENTLPIAFMFIPAEAIYYDLLVGEVNPGKVNARNLIDYAYREKKVIIVSPTTFMAYLAMVANGLKAFKVEENFKDIQKNIDALGKHLKSYEDYYKKMGNSLSTTINHYNAGSKEFAKIDKDVLRITGVSPELDTLLLDKPTFGGDE
ncbi:MAG TPA: DNA recombination protein RmuC [Candidatus Paceibacterota bacterium]|nr:DNA recombination protein RmuC [Candidatus Paceibacterota bacterium]